MDPVLLIAVLGALLAGPLDINRADDGALRAAGFTPSQAAQVLRYRSENGAFRQVDELLAVPQVSRAALAPLRAHLTVAGPPATPGVQVVTGAHPVRLRDAAGEWRNLYGVIVYAVNGTVENSGDRAVRAVRIRLELLDADGAVVAAADGVNLGAEVLLADAGAALDTLPAIPPGGGDPLRLTVDKADIERPFSVTRLTVLDAR